MLSLACSHRGLQMGYGRGSDDPPAEALEPFAEALACSLDRGGFLRALGRTVDGLLRNSQDVPGPASRLETQLHELQSDTMML